MRKIIKSLALVTAVILVSCSKFDPSELWNSIRDLENRVTALEELCKNLNTNIDALQVVISALEKNDMITNVSEVKKDGQVIGYSISFTKSDSITIFNGQDGKDGADGYSPEISVKRGEDGVYYWTVDNEWLLDESGNKVRAVGENGRDGADGEDGKDGADGADGADGKDGEDGIDGKDGICPRLKIEDDCWFVTYNDGETWINLGKATSDKSDNKDIFNSVDTSNDTYVIFTLTDGTIFKIPTWKAFEELTALCNRLNVNIASVQTIVSALQENDSVKNIEPVMADGKEIGYKISFTKSGTITIYHGQDGKDGADGEDGKDGADGEDGKDGIDGKDGYTPEISIRKDDDGVYYWILDGEWILTEEGEKLHVSGIDGKNGTDGVIGKDGVTPQFKIEGGYWYISYDDSATWTKLGKATGNNGYNGSDGLDGRDGIIVEVYETSSSVTFVLSDGSTVELLKNTLSNDPDDYIVFKDKVVESICLDCCDYDGDGRVSYAEAENIWDFNYVFSENTEITTFDELQYFTSLHRAEFSGCVNLTSIVLPESVEYIDFYNCTNLTKIAIPSNAISVSFYACENLKSIIVPGKVEQMDFMNCTRLESVTLAEGITRIGSSAFSSCENLRSINIPSTVTEIEDGALAFTKLSRLDIPSSVRSIGDGAFDGADLTEITLHEGLEKIGSSAFSQCFYLNEITIPETVTEIGDTPFYRSRVKNFYGKFTSSDNLSIIYDGTLLAYACGNETTDFDVPEGVTTIGESAFNEAQYLSHVNLPNTLTCIKEYAFSSTGISEITIPESVISILPHAFYSCYYLSYFAGKYASSDNRCLIVDGEIIAFAKYGIKEYTMPDEAKSIGNAAFSSSGLTSVIIPEGINSIGNSAFQSASSMVSITIPETVAHIGSSAFRWCYKLEHVYCKAKTPPTIVNTYWGWQAFDSNKDGRKIYVPRESVEAYRTADGWKDYAADIVGYDF